MNTENSELWELCDIYNVQAVSMNPFRPSCLIRQLYDAQQDTTDNIAKYYVRHREFFLGMDKRVNISSIQDMGEK